MHHDSEPNWEASDGSLPCVRKLVVILNTCIIIIVCILLFVYNPWLFQSCHSLRSWTWPQECPDLGDILQRKIPFDPHWVSCSWGTAPMTGLCPQADRQRTLWTSQCYLPEETWTRPHFEEAHQSCLSTIWEENLEPLNALVFLLPVREEGHKNHERCSNGHDSPEDWPDADNDGAAHPELLKHPFKG